MSESSRPGFRRTPCGSTSSSTPPPCSSPSPCSGSSRSMTRRDSRCRGEASPQWYEKILETPELVASVQMSLVVATMSSVLAVRLGSDRDRGHSLPIPGAIVSTFAIVPLVFPYLAIAVALLVTFVSVGVRLSVGTVIIGHTIVAIPYTVIIVAARLAGVDPSVEEAALDLGASRFRILRRIYLPLAAPAVAAFATAFICRSTSSTWPSSCQDPTRRCLCTSSRGSGVLRCCRRPSPCRRSS